MQELTWLVMVFFKGGHLLAFDEALLTDCYYWGVGNTLVLAQVTSHLNCIEEEEQSLELALRSCYGYEVLATPFSWPRHLKGGQSFPSLSRLPTYSVWSVHS